jgi:carbonic anhydrase
VQGVRDKHPEALRTAPDEKTAVDRLCELNVIEQVVNVCQTTVVREAWDRGQPVTVHGWIYGLRDGLVRQLGMCVRSADELAVAVPAAVRVVAGE